MMPHEHVVFQITGNYCLFNSLLGYQRNYQNSAVLFLFLE